MTEELAKNKEVKSAAKKVDRIVYLKKQIWKDPKREFRIFLVWNEDRSIEVSALGALPEPVIGGRYRMQGEWRWDTKRSAWQIWFDKCDADFDSSEEGVVNYLKTEINGIGEARARDLYGVYGVKTIETLRDRPTEISERFHINLGACYAISEALLKQDKLLGIKKQLYEINLTGWEIGKIIEKFGVDAGVVLRENCFQLTQIKGFGWQKTSKIADAIGVPKDDPNRIKAAIMYAVNDLTSGGHVCIYGHEIIDLAQKMLAVQHININPEIEALIADGLLFSEETDPEKVIEDQQVFQEAELDEKLKGVFR